MTGWVAFWIFLSVGTICGTYFSVRVVKMAYELQGDPGRAGRGGIVRRSPAAGDATKH